MQKNKTQIDDKVSVNISHFYDIYKKEKGIKYPSLFDLDTSSKPRKVTFVEFKFIIKTYLTIYFKELFFDLKPKAFFFGGYLKIVRYQNWSRILKDGNTKKEKIHSGNDSLGLMWYLRPTKRFNHKFKIKKLTGSSNILPKIEKMCKRQNDIDNIPIFKTENKRLTKSKQLYRYVFRNSSI